MEGRVVYEKCPLCESAQIGFLRSGDYSRHALFQPGIPVTVKWLRCEECEHVFTEGYWTADLLRLIFSKTHDNQTVGADMEKQRFVSAKMVDRVVGCFPSSWQPGEGRWLDVGFGNGSLLFTAEEYGFKGIGLDLRPESAKALAAVGVEAHCQDVADFKADGPVSVVSMADVLEHMPFPRQGLEAARRLLVTDGLLFVSCPAMGAPLWSMMDSQGVNPFWGELEHYHNFSRERLYALLKETGFTPLRYGVSERYRCCMEVVARAD